MKSPKLLNLSFGLKITSSSITPNDGSRGLSTFALKKILIGKFEIIPPSTSIARVGGDAGGVMFNVFSHSPETLSIGMSLMRNTSKKTGIDIDALTKSAGLTCDASSQ